jgi:osmotically-inducible protein OsmY
MIIKNINLKILLISLVFFLTSCVETIVVGSLTGTGLMAREKSVINTKNDIIIATKLGSEFIVNGLKNPGNSIDITVNERRVLLTGIARDSQKAKLAQDLAWKISGVREVIDEIQIHADGEFHLHDFSTAASDYIITAKIETKLLFAADVSSINYQITTVDRTVYVLGVAIDEEEMGRVLSIAAKTRGAEKIVNHVILKNDKRRN